MRHGGKAPASVGKEKVLRAMDVVGRHDPGQGGDGGVPLRRDGGEGGGAGELGASKKDFIDKRRAVKGKRGQGTGHRAVRGCCASSLCSCEAAGARFAPVGSRGPEKPVQGGKREALEGGRAVGASARDMQRRVRDAEAGHAPASEAQEAGQGVRGVGRGVPLSRLPPASGPQGSSDPGRGGRAGQPRARASDR